VIVAADAAVGRLDVKPVSRFRFGEICNRVMEANEANGKDGRGLRWRPTRAFRIHVAPLNWKPNCACAPQMQQSRISG